MHPTDMKPAPKLKRAEPRFKRAKHPGFKAVQSKIMSEGYSKKSAGAILANASRNASPAAKKANPNLKKV
jgi:hypothetical protein